MSETDKREVCDRHGWVGRKVYQRDRHDLCESPVEHVLAEDDEDGRGSSDDEDDHAIEDVAVDDATEGDEGDVVEPD
ncbi:MAG: hypothetical protein MUP97_16020, partial [Acidimicrobiia bacterium]|nr:hypothetical protein [Acidimicrobiia bacterium]